MLLYFLWGATKILTAAEPSSIEFYCMELISNFLQTQIIDYQQQRSLLHVDIIIVVLVENSLFLCSITNHYDINVDMIVMCEAYDHHKRSPISQQVTQDVYLLNLSKYNLLCCDFFNSCVLPKIVLTIYTVYLIYKSF